MVVRVKPENNNQQQEQITEENNNENNERLRRMIEGEESETSEERRISNAPPQISSKFKKLLLSIKNMILLEPNRKCLVYSQFTQCLDMIQSCFYDDPLLSNAFERLDGSMCTKTKRSAISNFRSFPDIKIFLISLKAGGVGLNLVEASSKKKKFYF